jgi:succinate-semialdehyde dehydrogenase/glutarate-semialdehyde dehydrogenase
VRELGVTGSPEGGKLLIGHRADQMGKVSLGLDGNAPFIVLDRADLDMARA